MTKLSYENALVGDVDFFRHLASGFVRQARQERVRARIWRAVAMFWFIAFACLGVAVIFIEVSK